MKLSTRIVFIAAWPLLALLTIVYGQSVLAAFPEEPAREIAVLLKTLGVVSLLYLANYLIAWRYSMSWTVTVVRMLVWAVIAFFFVSEIVDLLGENWPIVSQILGLAAPQETVLISELRLKLVLLLFSLIISSVCIAIGFETTHVK